MRVLSIGAHPDDVELAMAGTLIRHKNERDEVHVILCTLGGVCGDPEVRAKESRLATDLMGVDKLHVLDYPVSKLNNANTEFVKALKKIVDEIEPDRMYVHSPHDIHQVHTSVSICAVRAAMNLKEVLFFETISSTSTEFRPNAFVDITSHIDAKIRSVQAHKTQSHRIYLQPNVIRSVANYRYIQGKVGPNPDGFAESFRIHKMLM